MSELVAGQVTVADLYREIVGMRGDVARALERLALIDQRNQGADRTHADHEKRLRSLEERWWKLAGAIVVINFLLLVGAYWFIHH